eukprot:TRINITY_DN54582_c0_g1_i1.p1 TRINITY_DN54582_c0_g1~~TRINITY_DN54582_c0_g1_i1.p1  ORF type:complete len:363 (-),score=44.01 TRINITY_DN54582_c0_g1_i1:391-1434(-)
MSVSFNPACAVTRDRDTKSSRSGLARRNTWHASHHETRWSEKIEELADRGITIHALLEFYKKLGSEIMLHYTNDQHTTNDVVRQAIIPLTRESGGAYAFIAGYGSPSRPSKMVTHTWGNLFRDLVAAVIADALEQNTFMGISHLLVKDISVLERLLTKRGQMHTSYWICAFAVNQHTSICGSVRAFENDPVLLQPHPRCDCMRTKHTEGLESEINKFDDLLTFLATANGNFGQVVAADANFVLFTRAWCVAELAAAQRLGVMQHLKVSSLTVLKKQETCLKSLRVANVKATCQQEVETVLEKIADKTSFDHALQDLLFVHDDDAVPFGSVASEPRPKTMLTKLDKCR